MASYGILSASLFEVCVCVCGVCIVKVCFFAVRMDGTFACLVPRPLEPHKWAQKRANAHIRAHVVEPLLLA